MQANQGFCKTDRVVDSLKIALNTNISDTARISALNLLSSKIYRSNPDSALHLSKEALLLSARIISNSNSSEIKKAFEIQALTYNGLARVYKFLGRYKLANNCYEAAISISKKINDKKLEGRTYCHFADSYDLSGNDSIAEDYYKKSTSILNAVNDKEGLIEAYSDLGVYYEGRAKYALAYENLKQCISLAQQLDKKEDIADAYNNVGNVLGDQGNYPQALEYYLKSMKIMEGLNNKHGMSNAYYNIGNMYHSLGNYPLALQYLKQSLRIDVELNDLRSLATCYSGLGLTYASMDSIDQAMRYHMKSLKIREDLNDRIGLAITYTNLGDMYQEQEKYGLALTYFELALEIDVALNNTKDIAIDYNSLGSIYKVTGDYEKALDYLNKAYLIGKETGSKETVATSCEEMSQTYELMSNTAKALFYHKLFKSYQDSVLNTQSYEEIANMRAQYDLEKQTRDQELINSAKEARQNAELSKQKTITYSFGGGGILVLMLSLITLKGYNQKKKANNIISRQKQEVEEKQKEIMDSMTYAKRLQEAILPPLHLIRNHFSESFIFFQPKDIVAGDFYWFENFVDQKTGQEIYLFAVADCTGHGVPGAMVSVVCSNALNRAVKEFNITQPAEILDKVRMLVVETFSKSSSEVKDGMDISLFSFNKTTGEINWSGANNPLYVFRKEDYSSNPKHTEYSLTEIKADKQPIGKMENMKPFTNHSLKLNEGDTVYIFTDGYADQFGGEKGKKFRTKNFKNLLLSIQHESLEKQNQLIEDVFQKWKGNLMQVDDVCVMGIRYNNE